MITQLIELPPSSVRKFDEGAIYSVFMIILSWETLPYMNWMGRCFGCNDVVNVLYLWKLAPQHAYFNYNSQGGKFLIISLLLLRASIRWNNGCMHLLATLRDHHFRIVIFAVYIYNKWFRVASIQTHHQTIMSSAKCVMCNRCSHPITSDNFSGEKTNIQVTAIKWKMHGERSPAVPSIYNCTFYQADILQTLFWH